MGETASTPPVETESPFLALPVEVRQHIYMWTFWQTFNIANAQQGSYSDLDQVRSLLASRRESWSLSLSCRLVYTETQSLRSLRWANIIIAMNWGETVPDLHDACDRLVRAEGGFLPHLVYLGLGNDECVDDEGFDLVYGIMFLPGVRSPVVTVEEVDALLLEQELTTCPPSKLKEVHLTNGRTLRVEPEIVETPCFQAGMFTNSTTMSPDGQMQRRMQAESREKKLPYLWLPYKHRPLPTGRSVTTETKVVEVTWDVLKSFNDSMHQQ